MSCSSCSVPLMNKWKFKETSERRTNKKVELRSTSRCGCEIRVFKTQKLSLEWKSAMKNLKIIKADTSLSFHEIFIQTKYENLSFQSEIAEQNRRDRILNDPVKLCIPWNSWSFAQSMSAVGIDTWKSKVIITESICLVCLPIVGGNNFTRLFN